MEKTVLRIVSLARENYQPLNPQKSAAHIAERIKDFGRGHDLRERFAQSSDGAMWSAEWNRVLSGPHRFFLSDVVRVEQGSAEMIKFVEKYVHNPSMFYASIYSLQPGQPMPRTKLSEGFFKLLKKYKLVDDHMVLSEQARHLMQAFIQKKQTTYAFRPIRVTIADGVKVSPLVLLKAINKFGRLTEIELQMRVSQIRAIENPFQYKHAENRGLQRFIEGDYKAFQDFQKIVAVTIRETSEGGVSSYKFVEPKITVDEDLAMQRLMARAPDNTGGIDLDAGNLELQIKRDGRGMPLPAKHQDLAQRSIDALYPTILTITPITHPEDVLGHNSSLHSPGRSL